MSTSEPSLPSALVSELDKLAVTPPPPPKQYGENGHVEYGWSSDLREKILQFYYQCCRAQDNGLLKSKYVELLKSVFDSELDSSKKYELLVVLYKMVAQTRDIIAGKGEYNLAYMMITVWAQPGLFCDSQYHELSVCLAKYALTTFVKLYEPESHTAEIHPFGSWKDIKYFLNYWMENNDFKQNNEKNQAFGSQNEIVKCAIYLINCQLELDLENLNSPDADKKQLSLAAKWIPREKSKKFGWINRLLAYHYYKVDDWYLTCTTETQRHKARLKAVTNYRKLIAKLNKELGTVQINQCDKRWAEIDFDKTVTSITMSKQKLAFTNKTKTGNERWDTEDRKQCATNFTEYLKGCETGTKTMKGKRVSMFDFVKDALTERDEELIKTINLQWADNLTQNEALKNMIAMVDVSGSMEEFNHIPMYNAIGLGIRIAELSSLGKRVMTFSATPSWVSLDDCDNFVSMVKKVRRSDWGCNTNFYAAFDMILSAYKNLDKDPDEFENMTLVILSDMQMDEANQGHSTATVFETMEAKFAEAGMTSRFNKPFKLPTIVFWNLRSTSGFPTASTTKNAVMVTGYNPTILNAFAEGGVETLSELNPWNAMLQTLNHERYKCYETQFARFSNFFHMYNSVFV